MNQAAGGVNTGAGPSHDTQGKSNFQGNQGVQPPDTDTAKLLQEISESVKELMLWNKQCRSQMWGGVQMVEGIVPVQLKPTNILFGNIRSLFSIANLMKPCTLYDLAKIYNVLLEVFVSLT